MALILFFIILSLLVFVHELGHFSVAKFFGIRVDEFGFGYPPRMKKLFTWKNTLFTVNWLPLGGFVKIFGESYMENGGRRDLVLPESFQYKHRGIQAAVLVAGVAGNFLFAWLLLSLGFMTGLPAPEGLGFPVTDARVVITEVVPASPAESAGLKAGDAILELSRTETFAADTIEVSVYHLKDVSPESVSAFIDESAEPITFTIVRGGETRLVTVVPKAGIAPDRRAVGIVMEIVGTVELPFWRSITEGLHTSVLLTRETGKGLGHFLWEALTGRADFSGVAGPVGLVGMVGDVSRLGFGHLIAFTSLISINLCLINLLPFPALDGGRLLFVAIEAVTRRRIPARIFNLMNTAGFALLILLMIFITIHDVSKIF